MTLLGTRLGNIHLVELLGQGGMGEVYAGVDEKLGRKVAVKCLRHDASRDPQNQARLLREARILSQINHPNICRIYDFLEGEDSDFLVLELVDGTPLTQALRGPLDERLKMTIAIEIARVLVATHAENIIHRDLKPGNVMLTPDGAVKVLDFGVARLADYEGGSETSHTALDAEPSESAVVQFSREFSDLLATLPGGIPGTPHFMSPEQARGERLTTASDMYSFGLLLQQIFTGEPPYEKGLPLARLLLRASRAESRPVEGLDAELTTLIQRLKSRSPSARPTAVDTLARLETIRERPRRRLRRAATITALLILTLFGLVMSVLVRRNRQIALESEEITRLAVSRHLTTQSAAHLGVAPDLALLLALESQQLADTFEARSSLLEALLAHPRLERVLRSPNRVLQVAWSPDGHTLATGTFELVQFWDAAGGRVRTEVREPPGWILSLAWSPDGHFLAAGTDEKLIVRIDTARGRVVGDPLAGHQGEVWALAWSPDGALLASGDSEGTIRLWDALSGSPRRTWAGHDGVTAALVWSDDSRTLYSAGAEGTIRRWSAAEETLGEELGEAWKAHSTPILALARSGDGRQLATAAVDGGVRLWDAASGRRLERRPMAHEGRATWVGWSGDGRLLASGGFDRRIRLWDAISGEARGELTGHDDAIRMITAWRGIPASQAGDGHQRMLASSSGDAAVFLWDVSDRPRSGETWSGHGHWIRGVVWSPDGRRVVSAASDGELQFWDATTGRPLGPRRAVHDTATRLAVSLDGETVASAGEDGWIRLWRLSDGEPLHEPFGDPGRKVRSMVWSPRGALLAAADDGGEILVWRVATGQRLGVPLEGHRGRIDGLVWTPDGRWLISGGRDGTIRFWEIAAGRQDGQTLTGHVGPIYGLAISGDGQILASGGGDRVVRLWDVATRQPAGPPLVGHTSDVWGLAFRGDGRFLASGGGDKSIRLWDLLTRRPVAQIRAHDGMVMSLAWSHDGTRLVSGGSDKMVRYWELDVDAELWRRRACRRASRQLTREEWERFVGLGMPYRETCPELANDPTWSARGS